jgi:hypothetical protein
VLQPQAGFYQEALMDQLQRRALRPQASCKWVRVTPSIFGKRSRSAGYPGSEARSAAIVSA